MDFHRQLPCACPMGNSERVENPLDITDRMAEHEETDGKDCAGSAALA